MLASRGVVVEVGTSITVACFRLLRVQACLVCVRIFRVGALTLSLSPSLPVLSLYLAREWVMHTKSALTLMEAVYAKRLQRY